MKRSKVVKNNQVSVIAMRAMQRRSKMVIKPNDYELETQQLSKGL